MLATGVFITQAATSTYIGVAVRDARASAVGLYTVFYYAGGKLGSALPGWFWNRSEWPACVALMVVVQTLTIVVADTALAAGSYSSRSAIGGSTRIAALCGAANPGCSRLSAGSRHLART
jgi:sugar phosphate permease